jgi:hypothetical protein
MVLLSFICLPVLITKTLPLYDYPSHLARLHIILNLEKSSTLKEFYAVHWAVLPNLAMEGVILPLAQIMPLEMAGKFFVIITFVLLTGGALLLHYAIFKEMSYYPFISFLFVYSEVFLFGFLGYLFGLGLFLVVFSIWILTRDYHALFEPFLWFLFLCHLRVNVRV